MLIGSYDSPESYERLEERLREIEQGNDSNRMFYMALPPSVFAQVSLHLKTKVYSKTGWNKLIVEKPFGRDTESSNELSEHLAKSWDESEIYRIDHYLGKEMVKNMMVLRLDY